MTSQFFIKHGCRDLTEMAPYDTTLLIHQDGVWQETFLVPIGSGHIEYRSLAQQHRISNMEVFHSLANMLFRIGAKTCHNDTVARPMRMKGIEEWNLAAAGFAPRCPEVQDNELPAPFFQTVHTSVHIRQTKGQGTLRHLG